MNLNFDEMLKYAEVTLYANDMERRERSKHSFRSRYKHITRVLGWCKRIEKDLECDKDVLYTSAIFHDVGYSVNKEGHAKYSAEMFLKYANEHNFDKDFTDKVYDIILKHSNKEYLNNKDSSNELILLLEADLLDEEGALGLVWDLMARGAKHSISYDEALDEIETHSGHILEQDYMVTPTAKMYWNKKKKFVKEFIDEFKFDLFEE